MNQELAAFTLATRRKWPWTFFLILPRLTSWLARKGTESMPMPPKIFLSDSCLSVRRPERWGHMVLSSPEGWGLLGGGLAGQVVLGGVEVVHLLGPLAGRLLQGLD